MSCHSKTLMPWLRSSLLEFTMSSLSKRSRYVRLHPKDKEEKIWRYSISRLQNARGKLESSLESRQSKMSRSLRSLFISSIMVRIRIRRKSNPIRSRNRWSLLLMTSHAASSFSTVRIQMSLYSLLQQRCLSLSTNKKMNKNSQSTL